MLCKHFGERAYETEELSFFMPTEAKVPDKNNKPTPNGIWLESTAKISDYGRAITKVSVQRGNYILIIFAVGETVLEENAQKIQNCSF